MFKFPDSVPKKIIQLQRKFFWGDGDNKNILASISYDAIQTPRELGGLGVGCLKKKILSLLLKWWWKLSSEHDKLWKKVTISTNKILSKWPSTAGFSQVQSGPKWFVQPQKNIHGFMIYLVVISAWKLAMENSLPSSLIIRLDHLILRLNSLYYSPYQPKHTTMF